MVRISINPASHSRKTGAREREREPDTSAAETQTKLKRKDKKDTAQGWNEAKNSNALGHKITLTSNLFSVSAAVVWLKSEGVWADRRQRDWTANCHTALPNGWPITNITFTFGGTLMSFRRTTQFVHFAGRLRQCPLETRSFSASLVHATIFGNLPHKNIYAESASFFPQGRRGTPRT